MTWAMELPRGRGPLGSFLSAYSEAAKEVKLELESSCGRSGALATAYRCW